MPKTQLSGKAKKESLLQTTECNLNRQRNPRQYCRKIPKQNATSSGAFHSSTIDHEFDSITSPAIVFPLEITIKPEDGLSENLESNDSSSSGNFHQDRTLEPNLCADTPIFEFVQIKQEIPDIDVTVTNHATDLSVIKQDLKAEPVPPESSIQPDAEKVTVIKHESSEIVDNEGQDHDTCIPHRIYPNHFLEQFIRIVYTKGYSIRQRRLPNGHGNEHTVTFYCTMPLCGERFNQHTLVNEHLYSAHDMRPKSRHFHQFESSQCKLCCERSANEQFLLQTHLLQEHQETLDKAILEQKKSVRIQCRICGKLLNVHHCLKCGAVFDQPGSLASHLRVHRNRE